MEHFIGCDAHKKFSVFVAVNEVAVWMVRIIFTISGWAPQHRRVCLRNAAFTDRTRYLGL